MESIGGYFELELGGPLQLPYPECVLFESARSAFLALLRAARPVRVWVPNFICNAMLTPLKTEEIDVVWYDLEYDLTVDGRVEIDSGDWLLYVNYFGLCDSQVEQTLSRFGSNRVVLDFSQAYYSPPVSEALATIYSPRKFFGIPDGGLIACSIPLQPDVATCNPVSVERMLHLIKRLGAEPEEGYSDYCRAEASLETLAPAPMSRLTRRILTSIDFESARKKRRENFLFLDEHLGDANQFTFPDRHNEAPLCYPFRTSNNYLRQKLINRRIFVATYWLDSKPRVGERWAAEMVSNLLPLPIDQRYGSEDLQRVVAEVLEGSL